MPRSAHAVITLAPSSLRGSVIDSSGGVVRLERVDLDPSAWDATWEQDLAPLGEPLRAVLAALKLRGGHSVTVVYESASAVAEVFTVPTTGRAAMAAATLALSDMRSCTGPDWVSTLHPLRVEPGSIGSPARTHVLAIAEQDHVLAKIATLIERNGLKLERCLPARAACLVAAMDAAARLGNTDGTGVMFMSDHSTSLAARGAQGIELARCFDVGYLRLAEAIAAAAARESSSSITLSGATSLLFTIGVPARGQLVDPALGLRAEQVLPMMQSVLQRFVVEARQTLRFGLTDSSLTRPVLFLAGTGASIPNLTNTLTAQLDIPVETYAAPTLARPADADLAVVGACTPLLETRVGLIPAVIRNRQERSNLSRALRVGAVAAGITLAAHGAFYVAQRRNTDQQAASLAPAVSQIDTHALRRESLYAFADQLEMSEKALSSTLGSRPPWQANLHALARLTGPEIRLSEVLGTCGADSATAPTLTFRGVATPSATTRADDILSAFLERAAKHPLFTQATLSSSRSVIENDQDVRHFVITVRLRGSNTAPLATLNGASR